MLVYKKRKRSSVWSEKIKQPEQKTSKQMERHFKGVANHHRIEILSLVSSEDGITLDRICEATKGNPKTVSEHTKKLVQAGLLNKNRHGREVGHSLSPYGQRFFKFIKTF
ncbi:winged helix-turn-helix domain-containing protein [Patescibacteria group bacterium]|nr:winged helix-turn-helix domain-containing protein [Patescibacteria group bacterium]